MNKAAFLDRDGVINRKAPEGEYMTRWEEMQFLPGVAEAIALLNRAGFCVIVVTNQRCVAKGLMTAATSMRFISGCAATWRPPGLLSMQSTTARTRSSLPAGAASRPRECFYRLHANIKLIWLHHG